MTTIIDISDDEIERIKPGKPNLRKLSVSAGDLEIKMTFDQAKSLCDDIQRWFDLDTAKEK